jgi:hypothetical protein
LLILTQVIKFHARACKSVLRVRTKEITLEDCIPGGTYVKDIVLSNHSEMPLEFELSYTV